MARAKTTKSARARGKSASGAGGHDGPQGLIAARIAWLVFTALWLFLAAALVTFDQADSPSHAVFPHNDPTENVMGPVGAHVGYALLTLLGWGVIPLMLGAAGALVSSAIGRGLRHPILRAVGVLILGVSMSGLVGAIAPNAATPMPRLAGGTIGVVVGGSLVDQFHVTGAVLWMTLAAVIGLCVAFDQAVVVAARAIWRGFVALLHAFVGGAKSAAERAAEKQAARRAARVRMTDIDDTTIEVKPSGRKKKATKKKAPAIDEDAGGLGGTDSFDPADEEEIDEGDEEAWEEEDEYEYEEEEDDDARSAPSVYGADLDEDEDEDIGAPQVFDRDKLKAKIAALPVRFAGTNKGEATEADLAEFQNAAELAGYKFPPVDLLEPPEEGFNEQLEEYVREQAEALENALTEYKLSGEVVGIESGPVITLYHVALAPGTKVAQLNAIASDLARSLKSVNIRIVPNMVGRDTIGIEVPNAKKEKVRLRELMADRERFEEMKLPMFLGKDASGDPLIADLAKMPHVLIAGTTGSGKSVCMNTIVMSFLYTKKPNELKLVLVDPKMVEMSQFKDIPHLMCPVVTEMSKAAAILEWAVGKMDERYELLAEAGCRDIASYNELEEDELLERFTPHGKELSEAEAARIPRRLPYMVFIIDELADLMMTNKEVEGSIVRIAQKARAVGIHLILATQRPQANVVTGLIKGNMPCRISFKVASGLDSRIVLDQKGGELLLGMGDMLFLSPSSHKLMRSQGTLVDDKEIRRVTRFLKEVAGPSFERSLVQLRGGMSPDDAERLAATENNSSASLAAAQEDPLFDRAVEIVLETKRGSVSLLQRRLAIGYTRASRLIDLMGIAGIIGEHKGSVAREVLISPDEWEAIKEMARAMAEEQGLTPVASDDPDQQFLFAGGQPPAADDEEALDDAEEDAEIDDETDEGAEEAEDGAWDEAEEDDTEAEEDEGDWEEEAEEAEEDEEEDAEDEDGEYEYEEDEEGDDEEWEEEEEEEEEDEEEEDEAPFEPTDGRAAPRRKR